MTAREKKLATIVGAAVGLIANYLLIEFVLRNDTKLRAELRRKTTELQLKRLLVEEKDTWEQRDAWLREKHPKLTNEAGAGVALLDQVTALAKKQQALLKDPGINSPERRPPQSPQFISVSVNVETKSTWQALCSFLREMQAPEQFIVFERANIQLDPEDKTQMRGVFRVAKWFAVK